MKAQIGWKAGPEQFAPAVLLQAAIAAEAAGFETIDVSDHFHPWNEDGQACFTWAWLGAVAARTSRIRIGTGVTCPILRYHPAIVAQAAATIGVLAPGRAYLAVGTGEALNEYAATGAWPGYAERQQRMGEAIELIRLLWSGETVSYDGIYYQTRKAKLFTRPDQPLPLYISAMVPESAPFAGRNGDGLFTVGGQAPALYQQMFKNFDEGARAAGKQPADLPRAIELSVEYSDDLDAAIQNHLKYWAGSYVPALFDQKIYTPKLSAQNGAVVGPDTLRKKACISSKAEDHIQFIQRHIDLGFTEIYLHSAAQDQVGFLQRFSQDVLPHLHLEAPVGAA
jgi:coenzyme F420-dependent glucose-6-phosphate dehydrogenase